MVSDKCTHTACSKHSVACCESSLSGWLCNVFAPLPSPCPHLVARWLRRVAIVPLTLVESNCAVIQLCVWGLQSRGSEGRCDKNRLKGVNIVQRVTLGRYTHT